MTKTKKEKVVNLAMSIALHGWGRIYSGPTLCNDLEIIQPDRLPATFECEYCGTAYVVDLVSREIDCPGCGHPPPYDQLTAAISPPLFSEIDPQVMGMITGSGQAYASWQGANNLVERCRIDGKAPAVGVTGLCKVHGGGSSVYGRPITHENREAIREKHPEASEFINGLILGDQPGLKNWRK